MTVREYSHRRAKELCDFFRGLYGSKWRRVGLLSGRSTRCIAWAEKGGKPPSRVLCEIFNELEDLAVRLGFRPRELSSLLPVERNRRDRLAAVTRCLSCVILTQPVVDPETGGLTLADLLEDVTLHKSLHKIPVTDVISPTKLDFSGQDARIVNPRLDYVVSPELILDRPACSSRKLAPSQCDDLAHRPGGEAGAVAPLSGSRAILKMPRADAPGENFSGPVDEMAPPQQLIKDGSCGGQQ